MKISVIIVSWNVEKLLLKCIRSIKQYLIALEPEIIVVDNASCDGTVSRIASLYPEVRLIVNKQNIGYGAAVNQAVRVCQSDILLITNPDIEFIQDITPLLQRLTDEKTWVVFAKLTYPNGSTQDFIRNFPSLTNQLGENIGLPHIFPKKKWFREMIRHQNNSVYQQSDFINAGSGAFFAIKRKAFLEAQMFDEQFFVYGEETDLFYRIKKLGKKIFYEADITVIHHHGKSTVQHPGMYAMLQKNRFLFIKKHHSAIYAFSFRLLLIFYDLSRLAFTLYKVSWQKEKLKKDLKIKIRTHINALMWELFNES